MAAEVWRRFGAVVNFVEPFFGSGAVLLGRPDPLVGTETVNDLDGFVANFWRALAAVPDEVARYADWPVNENDLHARHVWLVQQRDHLRARLEGDPDWYDARIAGYWVWGMACWIGGGFCSGEGPWLVDQDGRLVRGESGGQGVHRKLVHLGSRRGVRRRVPIEAWFLALADRLRHVRVCSGDWSRVCGPTPTVKQGLTGVFLDPPYADTAGRYSALYREDSQDVAHAVREWAVAHSDDPLLRIALCGYEGEHQLPASWSVYRWKAAGGYGNQGDGVGAANRHRERIWFSKYCLRPSDGLFSSLDEQSRSAARA